LTAYGSYAEANRAPTPAELSCASPQDSCSLANFFVGDPNLKQVVAHTFEGGLRGSLAAFSGARLSYNVGVYQTDLDDDIEFINAPTLGRAYFSNVGETQRQGVDVGLQLKTARWLTYLQYSYINATFLTGFVESAGSNPAADANGNITVQRGDRLPGIPANQLKFGFNYKVTDKWTVGLAGVAASGAYLYGDEGNLTPKLPAYVTLDFNTQYQVTKHIQLFGQIQNLTDAKYYTYGTFSPTTSVYLAQAPNATNPRSYSPAAPIGGFGGVKVTF
jgi:outer membrane receptor protein involved in Fe transport